ncbi:4-oxalomesaconate tautomerase [Malaciobacter molluscorum]|uniref:2-methylaconitate cis-trans isomerase PrpF family protein n=1 Tax=Malaciobacter molluscorum TaxID=1032072 RepID=UPI00100A7D02|nr:PrpF domain-containing protein [Malaciobacter molluscorum]RXJ96356.1 4-oxalomesaconate tautomerase [Malaciobacter molluscorum]
MRNDLNKINCMIYRSGTSKGVYFLENDLPSDIKERHDLILKIMGSPDIRQIDGIGGATTVTTKVAIISVSKREGIDLDYKFIQPSIDEAIVDDKPTCGNILTAVGAFGLERGLVNIKDKETIVNVYDVNTGATISQTIQTPNRTINYRGNFSIPGVPGTAAPIEMFFKNIAGGKTGSYLPTGNVIDEFDGIKTTCIDISMPVVFVKAQDLGITGYETPAQLDEKKELYEKIEKIRELASHAMGLGSSKGNVIPKFAVISKAQNNADINIRYFTPKTAHPALAVSAGFCVSAGCFIKGTLLNQINNKEFKIGEHNVKIETPSGVIDVGINFPSKDFMEVEGKTTRTIRLLLSGEVLV